MADHGHEESPQEQGQQRQSQTFGGYDPYANFNLNPPTFPPWNSSTSSKVPSAPVPVSAPAHARMHSQTDNGIERYRIDPSDAMNMDTMGSKQPPRQHNDDTQRLQVTMNPITPMDEFHRPTLHRALNANQVRYIRYFR